MSAGTAAAATPREHASQDERGHRDIDVQSRRPWRPSSTAVAVLLVGLLLTAALAVTALLVYRHSERRLLNLRVKQLGLVLSGASGAVQTPLSSAAALADATSGSRTRFVHSLAADVGPGREFSSVSLWAPRGSRPIAVLGLAPYATARAAVSAGTGDPGKLQLVNLLAAPAPSVGFVYQARAGGYRVLAEKPLQANRRSRLEGNSAFADLGYALYFGRSRRTRDLLVTSERSLPIRGLVAAEAVPYGAGVFTLVVTPREPLGGGFFHALPWITAAFGVLIALAAAAMTDRLTRARRRAERLAEQLDELAAENRRRYIEQRGIARTLQQALLPPALPQLRGLRVSAQYVPAQAGGEVGGDWYDVVAVGEHEALLVIGDVSGHGIDAATTMALVRHAALAYIAQDPRPGAVLGKLSRFVAGATRDRFATVLCALVDIDGHSLRLASAGHLPPLLLDGDGGEFVNVSAEPPIGFPHGEEFRESSLTVPPGATLLAYTDGLVERRGEVLDEGLERLRTMASREQLDEDLLARLAHELTSDDHRDDTALVSIQWQS